MSSVVVAGRGLALVGVAFVAIAILAVVGVMGSTIGIDFLFLKDLQDLLILLPNFDDPDITYHTSNKRLVSV
ncbi:hypothetical protein PGT21_017755 [Puccinia graminis f. sp. tritici]|uniref:Uncharacterized protein n=1 Tax=Puccinia graminis f. sp. tritici TaxID=56615 RepID=A0A5B0RKJ5_PUCGR|nr:hypothetical protein PGT21_017755 [Puccinia graminis f. sp. tritici]KAA1125483.1 hypothetical protein PGTUg99_005184 [Puccinia graminis f. sp. tritici]